MELAQDRPEGYLFVRRVGERSVTLIDREICSSCLLTPAQVQTDWPVHAAAELAESHVQAILDLKPELVILGTGIRQIFPAAAFLAGFLRRGVGIEVMDNRAAARTYNLLASEGRHVVTGFILPT